MTGIKTALILAASLLVTAGCGDTGSSGTAQLDPATLETTTYRVDGMHCGGCAAAIATKVGQVDGVAACKVDLESGTAVVEAAPASGQRIQDAIVLLGYTVEPIENAAPGSSAAPGDVPNEPEVSG